jgi:plastocyanin
MAHVSRRLSMFGLLAAVVALAALTLAPAAPAKSKSGVRHYHFKIGPYKIVPGQNTIGLREILPFQKPPVDGYITRMAPNLIYANGKVPAVDVLHLHHGVWVNFNRPAPTSGSPFQPFFAVGEEKTAFTLPTGYGYYYKKSDRLYFNEMIHNLTTEPATVYATWDVDIVPAKSSAAKKMREVRPIWMDVQNGSAYPVFDAKRGAGIKGKFTYPDQAVNPYGAGKPKNLWTVDRDGTIVATAGHLHPGGLWDDMTLTRSGAGASARKSGKAKPTLYGSGDTVRLFRSIAKYYEPAGAVSWDVSMTGTPKNWPGVNVNKGDTLRVSTTYDTRNASWYEGMGIMVAYMADGHQGVNPYKTKVDVKGVLSHGHLPENNNHGGEKSALPDARTLANASSVPGVIDIQNFLYGQGDLSVLGAKRLPPTVRTGAQLTFTNLDASPKDNIFHTITACKAPCNKTTGVAYPLADGEVDFDSGELGFGPAGFTAASNKDSWSTPANLKPGTYTYFCRIHPFMRGSFRVTS